MDTLGVRLKKLREENGFTLEHVANNLNTTKTSIARYEKNEREPKSEMLSALADFYSVTTDYLLGRDEDINTNINKFKKYLNKYDDEILDIFKDYTELSEENKKIILQLIKKLNNDN